MGFIVIEILKTWSLCDFPSLECFLQWKYFKQGCITIATNTVCKVLLNAHGTSQNNIAKLLSLLVILSLRCLQSLFG